MAKKIGIYSGTFDPVHNGHIGFCLEAIRACDLEQVVLLPERQPRIKTNVTPMPHRFAMLELAVQPFEQLTALQLQSEQFSVQTTLPELQRIFAGHELTMLLGSDVVCSFLRSWPGLDILLQNVSLAIGLRQPDTQQATEAILQELQTKLSTPIRHTFVQNLHPTITSSHIRHGKHMSGDINPHVVRYMTEHTLYETVGA